MIRFAKAHACGNDFILVEEGVDQSRMAAVARTLCARSTGLGADGVEYLSRGPSRDFSIRLFNADGSEAELSGNGTRCVAAWLAHKEGLSEIDLRTGTGTLHCRVEQRDPPRYRIQTSMGVPKIAAKTVQLQDATRIPGVAVSIGNPHFVVFTQAEDFSSGGRSWKQLGAEICTHSEFPDGVNVEFVRVLDTNTIEFRIFERGVGPTLSSGTGSSASAAACMAQLNLARRLTVIAEGGAQTVDWPGLDESLLLTGPAEIIAEGECLLV